MLLGPKNYLVSLSANAAQLQDYLPPVDTIDATVKTNNGATGTLSISFGTTFSGNEATIACTDGVVSIVAGGKVTIGDETEEIQDEGSGVPPEVRAWGEGLAAGKVNERQSPEEALADLELIEASLRSGEQGGKPIALECQTW